MEVAEEREEPDVGAHVQDICDQMACHLLHRPGADQSLERSRGPVSGWVSRAGDRRKGLMGMGGDETACFSKLDALLQVSPAAMAQPSAIAAPSNHGYLR